MNPLRLAALVTALTTALWLSWPQAHGQAEPELPAGSPAAPLDGATQWLNSPPLSLSALRGKVVLVEFWTRECINCLHVLPHTKALYQRYGDDGLVVVGVHTPEYDEERDVGSVQAAVKRLGIDWPVVIDNDERIWNAYHNQYWPALYLIDRDGRVVYRHVGEGDYDRLEAQVRQALGQR